MVAVSSLALLIVEPPGDVWPLGLGSDSPSDAD